MISDDQTLIPVTGGGRVEEKDEDDFGKFQATLGMMAPGSSLSLSGSDLFSLSLPAGGQSGQDGPNGPRLMPLQFQPIGMPVGELGSTGSFAANVPDALSSGVLPSVDIEKSLDSDIIDPDAFTTAEPPAPRQFTRPRIDVLGSATPATASDVALDAPVVHSDDGTRVFDRPAIPDDEEPVPPPLVHKTAPQASAAPADDVPDAPVIHSDDGTRVFSRPVLDDDDIDRAFDAATSAAAPESDTVAPVVHSDDGTRVFELPALGDIDGDAEDDDKTASAAPAAPSAPEDESVRERAASAWSEARRARYVSSVYDCMFDRKRGVAPGVRLDINHIPFGKNVDTLHAIFKGLEGTRNPEVVFLRSPCAFGREEVMRAFFLRCRESGFTPYAEIRPNDGTVPDLVTSLVAGRMDIFPYAGDEKLLTKRILRAIEEVLEPEDRQWATDILFIRFGLRDLVSPRRGSSVESLVARNDIDSLELLECMIAADAAKEPVVIFLSASDDDSFGVWRDIVAKLGSLPLGNTMIVVGCDDGDVPDNTDLGRVINIAPAVAEDMDSLLHQVFAQSQIPDEVIASLVPKCGDSLTRMRRVVRLFLSSMPKGDAAKPRLDAPALLAYADAVPGNAEVLSHSYRLMYDDDGRRFLGAASLCGHTFFLRDVARMLSLEPLQDEVPGFRNMRNAWCRRISSALEEHGEIVALSQSERRGTLYEFPESGLFREMAIAQAKNSSSAMQGCYARYLERIGAQEDRIALAYSRAGMWPEAAWHWRNIAKRMAGNFYDRTAYELLRMSLEHIGPQYDDVYPGLLRECMKLSRRLGHYEEFCRDAETLNRMGVLLGDRMGSARAFLDMGDGARLIGAYDRATDMIKYALKLAEKLNNDALTSACYHSLAVISFESGAKGSLVTALRHAERALSIRRSSADVAGIAHTQTLCSRIYLRRGDLERAGAAATEAYRVLMATGHWNETPATLVALNDSAVAMGKKTDDYLERGFAVVDKTGNVEHRFKLLSARISLYLDDPAHRQNVRDDLAVMAVILSKCPLLPWVTEYQLLTAAFDYSRRNHKKTTRVMKAFFDSAAKLNNTYILGKGYALSAELNFDVFKRKVGTVSIEKTEKLYVTSNSWLESVGAWHEVADGLRRYAEFLEYNGRSAESASARLRAEKVDPYTQAK